jgi:predicted amidophosphoribosyltransferase
LGTRIPTSFDALTRRVYTKPQTRLKREERLKNVKHAFDVLKNAAVKDKRILLIDDVFTTGTTISECSRTLKDAGAKEVHAVTVARVLPGALNRNDREK